MAVTTHETLTIGELAKRTGVPVKTIRFYSDQGVLPPADVTEAGYRRYAEGDVLRLETIRTLRAAGFDVATIREMLHAALAPRDAMRLQIDAIAVQERTLRRQRLLLERALTRGESPGYPERGRALALLSTAERSAFLRNQLQSGVEELPVDDDWWANFLSAAVEGIADDLDDEQLAAWIELVEMIGDPTFAEAIRRTATPFWSEFVTSGGMSLEGWQAQQAAFVGEVRKAVRGEMSPESDAAMAIVHAWVDEISRMMEGESDSPRVRRVVEHMVQTSDPRLARYWELIATVKRMPYDRELDDAWRWIMTALQTWLARTGEEEHSPARVAPVR